jgi:hypothetical protein
MFSRLFHGEQRARRVVRLMIRSGSGPERAMTLSREEAIRLRRGKYREITFPPRNVSRLFGFTSFRFDLTSRADVSQLRLLTDDDGEKNSVGNVSLAFCSMTSNDQSWSWRGKAPRAEVNQSESFVVLLRLTIGRL